MEHYSPSVFNKNILNYNTLKMLTRQKPKIGSDTPDHSQFSVQL